MTGALFHVNTSESNVTVTGNLHVINHVGIGTASPGGTLDVAAQHGDITNPMVHFRANRDGASNGDGNVLKLENSGNRSDAELLQCVSSGNDRFIVRANGELAINGTTMSKAPRIVHIDDLTSGCPPTRPVGDIMSYSLVLTRPAYVYVSVTTILNYSSRSDCEIYFGSTHIQSHLTAADNTGCWNDSHTIPFQPCECRRVSR